MYTVCGIMYTVCGIMYTACFFCYFIGAPKVYIYEHKAIQKPKSETI